MADMEGVAWAQEEDEWKWCLEDRRVFSVKSSYSKLEGLFVWEDRWSEEERNVFSNIWKSSVPSKVVAFSWKLLLTVFRLDLILLLGIYCLQELPCVACCVKECRNRPYISSCIASWRKVCGLR